MMNFGANVPPGVLLRIELRKCCELLLIRPDIPRSDSDWFRECARGETGEMGDCMILDFERACPGGGPGDGVP